MIVVAIIGVLASIALPEFQRFSCRAKQLEGKSNVNQIQKLAQTRLSEVAPPVGYGIQCDGTQVGTNWLGFSLKGEQRYMYSITRIPSADAFNVIVIGCPGKGVTGDRWEATLTGVSHLTPDICG